MTTSIKSIEYKDRVVFSKATIGQFRRIPKYFVADESCFLFLTKGFFRFRTPDKVLEFSQGDGMLAKCGNYFIERPNSVENNLDETLEVVAAYFHPDIVRAFFPGDLSFSSFKPNYDASKVQMDEMLRIFMDGICFLLDNPAICTDDLISLKIKELLLLLAQSDDAPSIQHFIAALFKPYEYDFREIIQKNTDANLSLPELAMLCNMSLATFKRRFSEIFQESPAQYMAKEKLKKAAQMLAAQDARISDIVYDCGFETVTHFNKSFKKHFGQSPTEYRLSQKGKPVSR